MSSRPLGVAAFVVVSSLLVAACGGSGSGSASAAGSTTPTTVAGAAAGQSAFRDCLKKQGVDLPAGFGNRPRGGSGATGRPPGGFSSAGGGKFQKAFQACRGSLPAGGFGGGRRGGNPQQLQAYLSCLRDHGVKVPQITPGSTPGSTPGAQFGRGQSGLRAVRNDPKFAAANKTCRPLLPTFGSTTTTTTAS